MFGSTHHLPVEAAHDVSGEGQEALRRQMQRYAQVLLRSGFYRGPGSGRVRTHLLHIDAGLGAGFQELDPVVDGELKDNRTTRSEHHRTHWVRIHLLPVM